MKIPEFIKHYFCYNDALRKIVSIVTGILLILFNILSGFIISKIIIEDFLILNVPFLWLILIYIFPVLFFSATLLIFYINILNFFLKELEIESYTFLRLLLLVSIAAYFILTIFYIFIKILGKVIPTH